jgi:transcriptional regulator with XRE-family HTH domain
VARSFRVRSECIQAVKLAVNRNKFNTQEDVANHSKMALSTVSRFLNGKTVSCENFKAICALLDLDFDQIRDKNEINKPSQQTKLLSRILMLDYSLHSESTFFLEVKSTLAEVKKTSVSIKEGRDWNKSNLNDIECLLFLVSFNSSSIEQEIFEAILKIKKIKKDLIENIFSVLLIHVQSLMCLPLNHKLHQEIQDIDQFEWQSSGDTGALIQKIMDINTAKERLSNIKSFLPSLSQLEISKKWQLTYIGENQLQKLGTLVADLKNVNERQIRSGYSYWGLGPAYMWERACTDRVGYHMHENISNFSGVAKSLAHFIDPEFYNFVSLGVGEGSKDKILISDFFCLKGEAYPRDNFLYIPVDMSLDMLRISAEKTQDMLPHHRCLGIQRDIESYGSMAEIAQVAKLMGNEKPILYGFLGNTIANVENPAEVLNSIAQVMEPEDLLLFEVQIITDSSLEREHSYETVRKEYLSGAFRRFVESALLQNTDLRLNLAEMNNSYRVDVSFHDWQPYGPSLLIDCFFENNTSQPLYITLINGDFIVVGIQEKIRLLRSRKLSLTTLHDFVYASGFDILEESSYLNQSEGTGFCVMMLKRAN